MVMAIDDAISHLATVFLELATVLFHPLRINMDKPNDGKGKVVCCINTFVYERL